MYTDKSTTINVYAILVMSLTENAYVFKNSRINYTKLKINNKQQQHSVVYLDTCWVGLKWGIS